MGLFELLLRMLCVFFGNKYNRKTGRIVRIKKFMDFFIELVFVTRMRLENMPCHSPIVAYDRHNAISFKSASIHQYSIRYSTHQYVGGMRKSGAHVRSRDRVRRSLASNTVCVIGSIIDIKTALQHIHHHVCFVDAHTIYCMWICGLYVHCMCICA